MLLKLGRALGLTGGWEAAAEAFGTARDLAVQRGDVTAQAWARDRARGELHRKQGRYADAEASFDLARERLVGAGDVAAVAEVLHLQGTLAAQQGDTTLAGARYAEPRHPPLTSATRGAWPAA